MNEVSREFAVRRALTRSQGFQLQLFPLRVEAGGGGEHTVPSSFLGLVVIEQKLRLEQVNQDGGAEPEQKHSHCRNLHKRTASQSSSWFLSASNIFLMSDHRARKSS